MGEIDWKALAAPFSTDELEWRPGSTNKDKTKALALPYIQNRAIMNRLDSVVGPANWKNEFSTGPQGGVICTIYIRVDGEWIGKSDGAENTQIEGVKGGLSDSMKRAGVQWGIGRYLYEVDSVWHPIEPAGNSWRFVGTPSLKSTAKQTPPPKQESHPAAGEKLQGEPPAPPAAKIERPMSPRMVYDALRRKAEGFSKPADNVKISKSQLGQYHARMKEWTGDLTRQYLQDAAFGVEHSPDLTIAQFRAITSWLPGREALAGIPETIAFIEQEIAAIEIEAMEAAEAAPDDAAAEFANI
jgi:hypothetical protein